MSLILTETNDLRSFPTAKPQKIEAKGREAFEHEALRRARKVAPGTLFYAELDVEDAYDSKIEFDVRVTLDSTTIDAIIRGKRGIEEARRSAIKVAANRELRRSWDNLDLDVEDYLASNQLSVSEIVQNHDSLQVRFPAPNISSAVVVYSMRKSDAKTLIHLYETFEEAYSNADPGSRIRPVLVNVSADELVKMYGNYVERDVIHDSSVIVRGFRSSFTAHVIYTIPLSEEARKQTYLVYGDNGRR